MIVCDFDLLRVGSIPCETNAPLVIDANAVLTGTAAFQRLQSVARRQAEEGEFDRCIDQLEFDEGAALQIGWKAAGAGVVLRRAVPGHDEACLSSGKVLSVFPRLEGHAPS